MLFGEEVFNLYEAYPSHEIFKCSEFGFEVAYRAQYQQQKGLRDPFKPPIMAKNAPAPVLHPVPDKDNPPKFDSLAKARAAKAAKAKSKGKKRIGGKKRR